MDANGRILNKRVIIIISTSLILLGVSCIFAIGIGSVYISPAKVIKALFFTTEKSSVEYIIINNMRLARVIASIFGGASLALSGLLMQILFNNPIADPYVMGISSGARLFVGITLLGGITFGMNTANPWYMFSGAFIGAFIVMLVMLAFASKVKSITTLLLIGIMLGYLCSALVGVLTSFSEDHSLADFTKWNMGSFGNMTWQKIYVLITVCSTMFLLSIMLSKKLNALLLGEAYAKTMGVNTKLLRFLIILFSGILTAVVTAFAGLIAFVGMSVPHISRLLLKTEDARVMIPVTVILGGTFGVICDLLARTVVAPNELAIGTVTSFIGVPIVLFLLLKRNRVKI